MSADPYADLGIGYASARRADPRRAEALPLAGGFLAAFWGRPHAYLEPDVRRSASGLARTPPSVLEPAL